MKPERWKEIEEIYYRAIECEAQARPVFLDAACGGDQQLRREVETLLSADQDADSFLDVPAMNLAAQLIANQHSSSLIGKRIGHYEIVSRLGAGGMGEVYQAHDVTLHRTVALKFLLPEVAADRDRMRRFLQEARAASSLNHPNVATVYEIGEAEGTSFIAMEYVEGETLQSKIGGRPLEVAEVVEIGLQIADALDQAHAKGITHRDIKSANLMLSQRGQIKVLDFGLAKVSKPKMPTTHGDLATASGTMPGVVLGTVHYMSPEQVLGHEADHRTDFFSLGVVLYEMATGRLPFAGTTMTETMDRVLHNQPEALSRLNVKMPVEMERIVCKCLEKERERRYQTARELFVDLKNLQRNSASRATIVEIPVRLRRQSRRRVLMLLALVALGSLLIGLWYRQSRATVIPPDAASAPGTVRTPTGPRVSSGGPASANPEANRLFEAAMHFAKVAPDFLKARGMLARALALDPQFAEARAWHGFTKWLELDAGYANDSTLLYEAEDEMRRALQDDATLARAHAGFAAIYLMQGRKELIPAEVEETLKMNPDDGDALLWLLHYYLYSGDYTTAHRIAQQSLDQYPLFYPSRMILGEMLRQQGDLAGAIREQERILEQDPKNAYAFSYLARAYMDSGDLIKARQTLGGARPSDRQCYRMRRTWAILLALEGRRAEALKEMDAAVLKWEELVAHETSEAADFYAVLGDVPKALEWLALAVSKGDERAEYFRRDPLLATIRDHPRFQQILESIAYRRQQRKASQ